MGMNPMTFVVKKTMTMKISTFFLAAFFLSALTGRVQSQTIPAGTIKGRVFDKMTRQSLPGAVIVLKGTETGTASDTSGAFTLNNVREGLYILVISFVGYQEKTINEVGVTRNKTTYFETELEEAVISMKEVTVTAHRFENPRLTPVSTYGFSREEISRNPGAQGDIFRAIGMLPGVSSSGGEFSAIAVRGQGTRDNVYLVDEIPVTELGHLEGSPSPSGFDDPNGGRFSIFAPRVIDNAAFQGGGFSAIYGRRSASCLGLNIKEGNREDFTIDGQLDLMGITFNYDGPSYALKNTSLFLSARYQNLKQVENIANLKDLGLPVYEDLIFKSTSRLGSKNKLSVIAVWAPETFRRTVDNVKEDKQLNSLFTADRKESKIISGINLTTLMGKNNFLENILYFTRTASKNSYGLSYPLTDSSGAVLNGNDLPFENGIKTIDYSESKLGWRVIHSIRCANGSTLSTGIDLDRVDLSNFRKLSHTDTSYVFNTGDLRPGPLQYYTLTDPTFFNVDVKKTGYNASVYANYSFTILKRLSLNAGIRYDYTGFARQNTLSPRLSGSFQLNETSSLNFAAGIFYQDPVYSEIADQPSGRNLQEEKLTSVIAGYKKYFNPDLKLTIEGWYKKLDNLVVRPVIGAVEQNNSGDGYAYGADVSLTKRLTKKIHGQIGYSYMQSRRNDHNGMGEYDFAFSQPHQLNALIGYMPGKHWILSAKFRYATGKPTNEYIVHSNIFNTSSNIRYSEEITGQNKRRLPDFISLDIRADYRFQIRQLGLTAFVDIVDILNRQNPNGEGFNYIYGKTYYEGISIFPTFGIKFQL